ncbi:MAG TPA: nicotinate (nicotinamide) nucleotide adenylyltransferase [Thermoanaerobaculia bacterium]|jgi:nicotinate-nucleotide adenylyltransferase|nr:nicotinate (nicotinamide) nucleotide adenylyltransferase [Thermoanaerobaculia bacterium]
MRIGVFGGTFDPVHNGHVLPVEAAARKFQLQRVLYVPARLSPHKDAAPTDARHRVAMLALALVGRPDWSIDLEELDREPPSFTIDTLRAIAALHPADELWLLMGTDILAGFDRWREPEAITRLARIAAFEREPYTGAAVRVPEVPGLSDRLSVFDAGSVRISATELRNALAAGRSIGGKVPGPVAEYITKHGLYKSGMPQR